jgi:dihydroorotase
VNGVLITRMLIRQLKRFIKGHPRFFLGTDSAPHPSHTKETAHAHAGVFTTPLVLPYLANIFDSLGCLEKLENFACHFGKKFYGLSQKPEYENATVTLARATNDLVVPMEFHISQDGKPSSHGKVVPFWAGKPLGWKIVKDY